MQPSMTEPNRKIIISDEINQDVARRVIARITEVNDFDYGLQSNPNFNYNPEPIEMFINSGGGYCSDGFAIIGAMEMSTTPIVTYGLGQVASMALAIFVASDIRIAHKNTRFMYHSTAYGYGGYLQQHKDYMQEVEILQRMYDDLMEDRTKLSKEKMERSKTEKVDFYFSGKQAVEWGVADDLIKKPERKVIVDNL